MTRAFAACFLQSHNTLPLLIQFPGFRACLQVPCASVCPGLDFVRYACHNTGHHHLAAKPGPPHSVGVQSTARYRGWAWCLTDF